MNDNTERDPRLFVIPDTHGHCKGEHKSFAEERPLPLTARMLFLWFYHACRRGYPRYMMVADHMNYLTFEDPAAVNLVRRALKLAQAGDLYGAAETANIDVAHAAVVGEGLRRGMRFSIGAEVDNDPRSRPDAQNIVDAMRPDAMIRSVHFVPITHPVHGENWLWPFDNPEFAELHETVGTDQLWELYVAAVLDAVERLPGHILGHFFVPAVFGHWPDPAKLEEYEDRVLDALAARGMAIEFNTRFLYRDHSDDEKRRYLEANARLLRKAKERSVGIAIGSDAHSPRDQAGAFGTVLEVLDRLDINEIVFPIAGRLLRVALKVVRPEPEPEPPPPPPEPQKAEKPEPTPEPVAELPEEAAAPVPVAAKPVRKARPAAKAARPAETGSERPPERPEPEPLAEPVAVAPAEPEPVPSPVEPKAEPTAAEPVPAEPEATEPIAAAEPALSAERTEAPEPVEPREPVAQAVAPGEPPSPDGGPPEPEPEPPAPRPPKKAAPKPTAAKPVSAVTHAPKSKPPAKAAPAKPVPSKPAPAKAPAKTAAKAAAKPKPPAKAAPAKPAAKKAAPAKKKAPTKSPPARTTTAAKKKAPAKHAAPARKKPTAKKTAPARSAPARKAAAAKKTTTKKTATKRR
ncbi:MAG TPA: hypothetical protein VMA36_19315 [Candidatus Limnocylindria bacterium]|nr:hypothetical protein [Candidatus Limnocylindria bacterium]